MKKDQKPKPKINSENSKGMKLWEDPKGFLRLKAYQKGRPVYKQKLRAANRIRNKVTRRSRRVNRMK